MTVRSLVTSGRKVVASDRSHRLSVTRALVMCTSVSVTSTRKLYFTFNLPEENKPELPPTTTHPTAYDCGA